jgi:hypothetical protein
MLCASEMTLHGVLKLLRSGFVLIDLLLDRNHDVVQVVVIGVCVPQHCVGDFVDIFRVEREPPASDEGAEDCRGAKHLPFGGFDQPVSAWGGVGRPAWASSVCVVHQPSVSAVADPAPVAQRRRRGMAHVLLQDPVPQVIGVLGLDHLGPFQLDRTAEVFEQPGTAVQDYRGDVQEQFVDKPGRQRLLDDAGAATIHPAAWRTEVR